MWGAITPRTAVAPDGAPSTGPGPSGAVNSASKAAWTSAAAARWAPPPGGGGGGGRGRERGGEGGGRARVGAARVGGGARRPRQERGVDGGPARREAGAVEKAVRVERPRGALDRLGRHRRAVAPPERGLDLGHRVLAVEEGDDLEEARRQQDDRVGVARRIAKRDAALAVVLD